MEADAAARVEMEKLSVNEPSGKAASEPPPAVAAEPLDPAKRLKKVEKALKAIDQIKEKKATGAEINEDQKAKLATEAELLQEAEELKKQLQ
jgi:translation initiation factor 2A